MDWLDKYIEEQESNAKAISEVLDLGEYTEAMEVEDARRGEK
jgi:hypothetical protein